MRIVVRWCFLGYNTRSWQQPTELVHTSPCGGQACAALGTLSCCVLVYALAAVHLMLLMQQELRVQQPLRNLSAPLYVVLCRLDGAGAAGCRSKR
jgi:hypothetical protein